MLSIINFEKVNRVTLTKKIPGTQNLVMPIRHTVTRSFGDIQHKSEVGPSAIDPIPETFVCPIRDGDEFLLLGTDGLFDVISPQEAVNILKRDLKNTLNCEVSIQNLVKFALKRGSCDNVTAMLIMFQQV